MKTLPVLLFTVLAVTGLRAQQVVEIAPVVVSGTFESRRAPGTIDLFAKDLEKQIETKRAIQEAIDRSPILNAPFWSFIPIRLQSSANPQQFFIPNYATPEYRETSRGLDNFLLH